MMLVACSLCVVNAEISSLYVDTWPVKNSAHFNILSQRLPGCGICDNLMVATKSKKLSTDLQLWRNLSELCPSSDRYILMVFWAVSWSKGVGKESLPFMLRWSKLGDGMKSLKPLSFEKWFPLDDWRILGGESAPLCIADGAMLDGCVVQKVDQFEASCRWFKF